MEERCEELTTRLYKISEELAQAGCSDKRREELKAEQGRLEDELVLLVSRRNSFAAQIAEKLPSPEHSA